MAGCFIPGMELAERLYQEAVKPILTEHFPELGYSAALIGEGSDVLGFDTPQSIDHDWGPRLLLFLSEADYASRRAEIDHVLRRELPVEIEGHSTNFGWHEDGTRVMVAVESGPVNHRIALLSVPSFFTHWLNFDPEGEIGAADWVSVPEQQLLMLTAGRVFHDGLGRLEPIRARLSYYPHDVWLYLLAAQWRRIEQEEAFVGRCAQVGDDLGSRLVVTRLVRDLMRLCFLMERRYAPYIKWFGSAFAGLECAPEMLPILTGALQAGSWGERQASLSAAYEAAARMHNALGITAPLTAEVSYFYQRPFLVIHADRFVEAIRAEIESEQVLALPEHLGSVDQWVDSTDAWEHARRIGAVYQAGQDRGL